MVFFNRNVCSLELEKTNAMYFMIGDLEQEKNS